MSKIVTVKFFQSSYSRNGQGTMELTLDCGHKEHRKTSQYRPGQNRVKCRECYYSKLIQEHQRFAAKTYYAKG